MGKTHRVNSFTISRIINVVDLSVSVPLARVVFERVTLSRNFMDGNEVFASKTRLVSGTLTLQSKVERSKSNFYRLSRIDHAPSLPVYFIMRQSFGGRDKDAFDLLWGKLRVGFDHLGDDR